MVTWMLPKQRKTMVSQWGLEQKSKNCLAHADLVGWLQCIRAPDQGVILINGLLCLYL